MKKIVVAALASLALALVAGAAGASSSGGSLTGAGSSFVALLVQSWIPAFDSAYGIKVTYSPIGSGGGITAISNRGVDFGASDAPLTPDQFSACHGCVQIPWALSATAIAYRVDGAPNHLHLTGKVLSGIFLGKIKRWNDPAIRKLNKGADLPATSITVIHRSDNSGTTYNVTDYLSSVSSEWRSQVGRGVAVSWNGGVGAPKSNGVAAALSQTDGGIAYIDVAYVLKNHFKLAAMQNRAGKFQLPGLRGISAAAATITKVQARNSGLSIVNPPKSQPLAYPISTFTYAIVPQKTGKAKELKQFVFWALTQGQKFGPKLLFAPVPRVVLGASERTLSSIHS